MISGKRHISSRRAAREYNYNSDYIGQLIRANKITGQKVGRTWYVSVASLDAFMRKEATKHRSSIPELGSTNDVVSGSSEADMNEAVGEEPSQEVAEETVDEADEQKDAEVVTVIPEKKAERMEEQNGKEVKA